MTCLCGDDGKGPHKHLCRHNRRVVTVADADDYCEALAAALLAAEREKATARELLTEFKRVLHLICQDNRIHMNSSHIALGMKVERWLDAARAEKGET